MKKGGIKQLIEIIVKAGTLKQIKRTGWVLKGVDNAESVADHTWRMGLMITLLAPKSLDKQKLHDMNAIHDLGEIGVGDLKWEEGKKIVGDQAQKQKDEIGVMEQIFGSYKNGGGYIELLREFNEQKTPEAKFLKQIDKLEMAIQAFEYERAGETSESLDEFWENAGKYLKNGQLWSFFEELKKLRRL